MEALQNNENEPFEPQINLSNKSKKDDDDEFIEPELDIENYLNVFFQEVMGNIIFEEDFISKNSLTNGKADYFKLKRFMSTALRNFHELDEHFMSGLILKLKKDVYGLFDYYQKILNETRSDEIAYDDFLLQCERYQILAQEAEGLKSVKSNYELQMARLEENIKIAEAKNSTNPDDRAALKKLKELYVDCVHNFATARDRISFLYEKMYKITDAYKPIFMKIFSEQKVSYLERLKAVINVKAFHLDKLIWAKAEQSRRIVEFMKNSNIDGSFDMKTFIKYYMKNINAESSMDKEWHMYLVQVIKLLD